MTLGKETRWVRLIEQGLTSAPTQYKVRRPTVFTGLMTQPKKQAGLILQ